jgi:[ribosomal protein S5]-alanine N-acetyltransferase
VLAENWLWAIRVEQIRRQPESVNWVARIAVVNGLVVGHGGFHGPPSAEGTVEVAYAVDPVHRGKGHAKSMLAHLLDRARAHPDVRLTRATIAPTNAASLATVRANGFTHVGQHWDEEDGLELVFESGAKRHPRRHGSSHNRRRDHHKRIVTRSVTERDRLAERARAGSSRGSGKREMMAPLALTRGCREGTVTADKKNIHTVPTEDGWANRREGGKRASSTHDTKAEAQAAGRAAAKKDGVEHLIHKKDGTIGDRNSYGNDLIPRRAD